MNSIHFIQAGGTIDKDYLGTDEHHGYNFVIDKCASHAIWNRAGAPYLASFVSACRKDSLDMDDDDRESIKKAVMAADAERIVILHGTDTIQVTAKHISDIQNKVIVLTGAMAPERFRDSDADFNVGMAVGVTQTLPPGVYIALYGEVKRWDEYEHR